MPALTPVEGSVAAPQERRRTWAVAARAAASVGHAAARARAPPS
ncbi:MAG: hypothetical protein U0S48_00135 [Solirubrobacteraceae bacterium]